MSRRSAAATRYWSTVVFDPSSYRIQTVGAANVPPFYALGPQKRVIALDVPHVRPAAQVDGAQVIGSGGHGPQYPRCSLPPGLLETIEERAGQHRAAGVEYTGAWNRPASK